MNDTNPEAHIQEGLISVIMSVHNTDEEYLRYAIESILNQTYTNFEFIIIDDGSTNNALAVIESYHDDRIIIIKNAECLTLPISLNKGMNICRGEYVARFDSDDYSHPERLEVQYKYMKEHPGTIVCGTGIRFFGNMVGNKSDKTEIGVITDNDTYKAYLLFRNMPIIYHSSAMISRKLLLKHNIRYDESKKYAQDYKMWVCCSKVADCTILPDVLVDYRIHDAAISTTKIDLRQPYVRAIVQEQLKELHLDLTDENEAAFWCLGYNKKPYRKEAKEWIKNILTANQKYHIYHQRILKRILKEKWVKITYYGIHKAKTTGEKIKTLSGLSPLRYPRLARLAFSKWYRKRG